MFHNPLPLNGIESSWLAIAVFVLTSSVWTWLTDRKIKNLEDHNLELALLANAATHDKHRTITEFREVLAANARLSAEHGNLNQENIELHHALESFVSDRLDEPIPFVAERDYQHWSPHPDDVLPFNVVDQRAGNVIDIRTGRGLTIDELAPESD